MQVEFFCHDLGPASAKAVARVLATPFLTSGGVGRDVEAQLTRFFGTRHAALVSSWTSGATAALLALGIGPGDEVIVPAMTFIATSNVVEMVGAKPVFVDVDAATLLMTPEGVARAITSRTKAVIPVHLYGQMVDMVGLKAALAGHPEIAIIEDCAHSFESERGGEKPGLHSTCAIFSFYATKNVTCGEGGAVVSNDSGFYEKLLMTRLHGMSAGAIDRFKGGGYRHWDMTRLGVKANLPDLLAALLPAQIETVDERLQRRQLVADRYERALRGTPIRIPERIAGATDARHLFVIHVPAPVRDDALGRLAAAGIGCTVNYRSVPTLTYYAGKYGYMADSFPVSHWWGQGTISLPLYPSLAPEKQDYVIQVLEQQVLPLVEGAAAQAPGADGQLGWVRS